ncbi:hypothetical protein [Rothia sp. CCM 9418]|uniref:hypothetical protein n=1 Tax=unclassified Rothia (in: high G+C Gram-positive bacteria) TaxID=2689056 RepID=UPI003ACECEE7
MTDNNGYTPRTEGNYQTHQYTPQTSQPYAGQQPIPYSQYMGYTGGQERTKPVTPQTIKIAASAIYVLVGFYLISNIYTLFFTSADTEIGDETLEFAAKLVGVVFSLAILGFYILLAILIAKGTSWARIVMTVISGLSIFTSLVGLFFLSILQPFLSEFPDTTSAGPFDTVIQVLVFITSIVIIVALWMPKSHAFFTETAIYKRQQMFAR